MEEEEEAMEEKRKRGRRRHHSLNLTRDNGKEVSKGLFDCSALQVQDYYYVITINRPGAVR